MTAETKMWTRPAQGLLFHKDHDTTLALEQLLVALPKIDLHAHLSGCVRMTTVYDLVDQLHVELPEHARRDLEGAVVFRAPARSYSASFYPWRLVLNKITYPPKIVSRLILETAEDFARDGVLYSELRVSPRLPLHNGDLDDYLREADAAVQDARDRYGIQLRIILGLTRQIFSQLSRPQQISSVTKILRSSEPYHGRTVVGFDLWGNEERFPPRYFAEAFRMIAAEGYPLTIHAGETPHPETITEAIWSLGARRLGHGIAASLDEKIMETVRSENVLLEICLSSNWITGVVKELSAHPLRQMLASGVSMTLGTDNTLIYDTTMSRELAKALTFGLISTDSIPGLIRNAAVNAFCGNTVRTSLLSSIDAFVKSPRWASLLSDLNSALAHADA